MQEMCVSLAKSTIDLPDDDAKVKTRFAQMFETKPGATSKTGAQMAV